MAESHREQRIPLLNKSQIEKNSIEEDQYPKKQISRETATRHSFREYFHSCLGGNTKDTMELNGDDDEAKNKATHKMDTHAKLFKHMKTVNDWAVFFAALGFGFMMADMENIVSYRYNNDDYQIESYIIKGTMTLSTIILIVLLIEYHRTDIKMKMISHDTLHMRNVVTWRTKAKIILEIIVCALHVPIGYDHNGVHAHSVLMYVDFALNIAMFLRIFLVGRMMRLHSSLHIEKSTTGFIAASFSGQFPKATILLP